MLCLFLIDFRQNVLHIMQWPKTWCYQWNFHFCHINCTSGWYDIVPVIGLKWEDFINLFSDFFKKIDISFPVFIFCSIEPGYINICNHESQKLKVFLSETHFLSKCWAFFTLIVHVPNIGNYNDFWMNLYKFINI